MFQFPPLASHLKSVITGLQPAGLSHSDTPGSQVTCTSPGIFAACRVLRRLREPRHPPCALRNFRSCSSYFQLSPAPQSSRKGRRNRSFGNRKPKNNGMRTPWSLTYSLVSQNAKEHWAITNYELRIVNCGTHEGAGILNREFGIAMVENIGVEPMTSCMPCKRSSQLS